MNALKRTCATLLISAGLTAGAVGVAAAAVEYVGGGIWDHGLTSSIVYSDYYHGSVCHGSTAVGTKTVRASAPAGYWSLADAPRDIANNQAYWRTTC